MTFFCHLEKDKKKAIDMGQTAVTSAPTSPTTLWVVHFDPANNYTLSVFSTKNFQSVRKAERVLGKTQQKKLTDSAVLVSTYNEINRCYDHYIYEYTPNVQWDAIKLLRVLMGEPKGEPTKLETVVTMPKSGERLVVKNTTTDQFFMRMVATKQDTRANFAVAFVKPRIGLIMPESEKGLMLQVSALTMPPADAARLRAQRALVSNGFLLTTFGIWNG